jgi:hypothetical protein
MRASGLRSGPTITGISSGVCPQRRAAVSSSSPRASIPSHTSGPPIAHVGGASFAGVSSGSSGAGVEGASEPAAAG